MSFDDRHTWVVDTFTWVTIFPQNCSEWSMVDTAGHKSSGLLYQVPEQKNISNQAKIISWSKSCILPSPCISWARESCQGRFRFVQCIWLKAQVCAKGCTNFAEMFLAITFSIHPLFLVNSGNNVFVSTSTASLKLTTIYFWGKKYFNVFSFWKC